MVLAGTGPLLYLVAYQYAKAGAKVTAVLDCAAFADQVAAAPALLRDPLVLGQGLFYVARLQIMDVPVFRSARLLRASGSERVDSVSWHDGRREHSVPCDAIGFGHALRSETQLADLLGCDFAFDPLQRAHMPVRDVAGRSSIAGVYLAGDGAGVRGANAAELAGERAALALLQDRGVLVDPWRVAELDDGLTRSTAMRQGLERAFPFPDDWAALAPDDLVLCRCEEITVGQLRQLVREGGADELNRAKALTRVGMGRCQGRYCAAAAAEVLAQAAGVPLSQIGRLRGQAPVKPIPFAIVDADLQGAP